MFPDFRDPDLHRPEIGADHLQAVSARAIRSQHQSSRFQRLLNYWDLTPVEVEIDDLPGFGFLAGQFLLDLLLELLFRHFPRFMQPGCTIEVLPVPPCQAWL